MSKPLISASVERLESMLAQADSLLLTSKAQERLRWLIHYRRCGSVAETCKEFGINRMALYRLASRFDPSYPATLEDRFRRPHAPPSPVYLSGGSLIRAYHRLCPELGHATIAAILADVHGLHVPSSSVERVLLRPRPSVPGSDALPHALPGMPITAADPADVRGGAEGIGAGTGEAAENTAGSRLACTRVPHGASDPPPSADAGRCCPSCGFPRLQVPELGTMAACAGVLSATCLVVLLFLYALLEGGQGFPVFAREHAVASLPPCSGTGGIAPCTPQ